VVNAGVSGETSAGALRACRGWLIRQPFDVLVVETGANDMLRGADLDSTARQPPGDRRPRPRRERPERAHRAGGDDGTAQPGPRLRQRFHGSTPRSRAQRPRLVPFLLEDVGGVAS
jgi:acyl-CoA thioesterase I